MKNIEVLAPAGSIDAMKAAFAAGADAVYIGGSMFGARAYADNPDEQALLEAIDYAHLHQKKLYLTVNTLMKNKEIDNQLYEYLHPLYECGLDAVIVQDIFMINWLKTYFPHMDIHASTQMTICGTDYGKWLADHGVARIVTPRELSIHEIAEMKQKTNVEIETFVHGALCYCYSGQCLMSSMIGGRSGNRGRCAQPCRLQYEYQGERKKTGYLLSPKDLLSLEQIPDLIDAGVDSLKIEGRMKKPEYAALTAYLYRKYTDQYLEKGRKEYRVDKKDIVSLMDMYNRGGFTKGYFFQHNGKEMMSVERPNHSGTYVADIASIQKQQLTIVMKENIHKGDVLELPDGSSYKMTVDATKGKQLKINYKGPAKINQKQLMRTRNETLIQNIQERFLKNNELKEKISGNVILLKDLPAKMEVIWKNIHITVEGDQVTEALNRPLNIDDIKKRLMKTGQTPFEFESLNIKLDKDCYMGIQSLNQMRRDALELLRKAYLEQWRRKTENPYMKPAHMAKASDGKIEIAAMATTKEQIQVICQNENVKRVYIPLEGDKQMLSAVARYVRKYQKSCYFVLPYILRDEYNEYVRDLIEYLQPETDGYLIRNMESLLLLRKMGITLPVIADYTLYGMNDHSRDVYGKMTDLMTLPLELNRKELFELSDTYGSEMMVYGYFPLMITAQCSKKLCDACQKKSGYYQLKDRMKKTMIGRNVCDYCYNLIYNTVPLDLSEAIEHDAKKLKIRSVRLQFLNESADEVNNILQHFSAVLDGKMSERVERMYTKGHYQRGVE